MISASQQPPLQRIHNYAYRTEQKIKGLESKGQGQALQSHIHLAGKSTLLIRMAGIIAAALTESKSRATREPRTPGFSFRAEARKAPTRESF